MKIAICMRKEVEVNHPVFEKILKGEKEYFEKGVNNPITDEEFEQAIAIVEELAGFKFVDLSEEDFKDFTINHVYDVDSGLALLEL